MKTIKMLDIRRQDKRVRRRIRKSWKRILKASDFINGKEVDLFQARLEQYMGVEHVIPCANGTDALQIALMALNLEPGDEIIVPAFSFVSTAEVVKMLGLKVVFVDIDCNTFNIDATAIESAITDRTRAIIPAHLFGQCADMALIMDIAARYNLFVIEDACQSLGADYILREGTGQLKMGPFTYDYRCVKEGIRKKAGTVGHIGCVSFFPGKNLGAYGDGGAIFTNSNELADRLRKIARHGSAKPYVHSLVGVNSRLDSLQAAVLNAKLPYLDRYNEKRAQIAMMYDRYFVSCMQLKVPGRATHSSHIFHQYCLLCRSERERNTLRFHLESLGIPSKVYYPAPLHLQKAFADLGYKEGDFPVAESTAQRILAIPVHPLLKRKQVEYIAEGILSFFD